MAIIKGLFGIFLVMGISFLFSNNKRRIDWKLVSISIFLQFLFAALIIHGELLRSYFFLLGLPKDIVSWIGSIIIKLLGFVSEGTKFLFGDLATKSNHNSIGPIFAFKVLPNIIFFSTLTAILYYFGVLQNIVKFVAFTVSKIFGTTGAESLANIANIFIGQAEVPLIVRPYIFRMTRSELFTVMVSGMGTLGSGIIAIYIGLLGEAMVRTGGISNSEAHFMLSVHFISASIMAAPASLAISKILYPETQSPKIQNFALPKNRKKTSNFFSTILDSISGGMRLAFNIGAMLLCFIAFIHMFDFILIEIGNIIGINEFFKEKFNQPLSLELILGVVLKYIALGIGVPHKDAIHLGSLLGIKVVFNEFLAYVKLTHLMESGTISGKGMIMSIYALSGFANFSSIAIQVGAIGAIDTRRRNVISSLGVKAVIGGSLVSLLTASIAGIFL